MSLSSLIVQREIATIREVEEALARQVLYGGDLVTNLLEVSRVSESALMPVVAESFGLPPAAPGPLPSPGDEVKRIVVGEVAAERNFAPISVDRYGLVIAVAEPLKSEVEQELAFTLALPISQRIAPHVRIREALARDYGIPLERRMQRLLGRLRGERPGRSTYPPRRIAPSVRPPPKPPSAVPLPLRSRPPDARAALADGAKTLLRALDVAPSARPVKRRRGPLTADVARTELEEADERDAIFDLAFEYARQFFDYTALFVLHGEVAEGRDAFGDGASREKIVRVGVPLDHDGMLARARASKAIVRQVPASEGIDPVLMSDLGRRGTTECVVLPIVVRTRVVALLLGDGGDSGIDERSLVDVKSIVNAATAAFERLIVRRKLKGGAAATKPGEASSSLAPPSPPVSSEDRAPEADPSIEELAPPIRELMAEPISSAPPSPPATTREPPVEAQFPPMSLAPDAAPPPANLLSVRRPAGPPIPREEPSSEVPMIGGAAGALANAASGPRTRSSAMRRAQAPPLEFGAREAPSGPSTTLVADGFTRDEVERALLDEIHGSSPAPSHSPSAEPEPPASPSPKASSPPVFRASPPTAVSPGALPVLAPPSPSPPSPPSPPPARDETPIAPPSLPESALRPMPPSEQQISVAAHRPPSARSDHTRVLPSVIVDVASEYVDLVRRVVEASDEEAEAQLVRAGGYAMPAIMAQFPGPITIERERLEEGSLPRVADCGPVLRVIASQRRTALPFVLAHVDDPDSERRFWATYLLTELVYADAIEPVFARIFDESARVQRAARAAARALAEVHAVALVDRLAPVARNPHTPTPERVRAVEALGEMREARAVPALVGLLDDAPPDVTAAAHGALVTITRQDFGFSVGKWQAWWSANQERHRLEWLIDALMHDSAAIRAAAGEELKTITKEYFGYYDDLPKRERERAQARYREWWTSVGRVRFSPASSRRG